MINPVRYSGRSGSISHASPNMSAGPTTQFNTSDDARSFRFDRSRPISPYFTFASTGYIIAKSPMAIGNETPASFTVSSAGPSVGQARPRPIPIAIALSPFHLESDEHLDERWIQDMAELGVAARSLAIQVNERMLSDRSDAAAERLRKLGRYGLQIAVDDFGAGMSCLAELQRSDIRYLRLSRSLIDHASPGSRESAMCEAIVKMAHTLGIQAVAVGVETEAQRAFVGRIGCDYAQGRLLALPMSPRELEGLMA